MLIFCLLTSQFVLWSNCFILLKAHSVQIFKVCLPWGRAMVRPRQQKCKRERVRGESDGTFFHLSNAEFPEPALHFAIRHLLTWTNCLLAYCLWTSCLEEYGIIAMYPVIIQLLNKSGTVYFSYIILKQIH